jgi:hypothetical protein
VTGRAARTPLARSELTRHGLRARFGAGVTDADIRVQVRRMRKGIREALRGREGQGHSVPGLWRPQVGAAVFVVRRAFVGESDGCFRLEVVLQHVRQPELLHV